MSAGLRCGNAVPRLWWGKSQLSVSPGSSWVPRWNAGRSGVPVERAISADPPDQGGSGAQWHMQQFCA